MVGFAKLRPVAEAEGSVKVYRNTIHSDTQSDILDVTLDVTLNGTEKAVYAILKQKPDSSREEISEKISKTVRTVQRALDSLKDKGYIKREGSRQYVENKI